MKKRWKSSYNLSKWWRFRKNWNNRIKGDYLIFLHSYDVFDNSMIEDLFAKIKGNDDEIVLCNSIKLKNVKGKIKIIKKIF